MRRAMSAAMLLATGAAGSPERLIADAPVPVTLGTARGTMIVDPGAPSLPLVTTDFAARAGLKAGPFALGFGVGPVMVRGRSAVGRIDFGGGADKHRIGWTDRPYIDGADGADGAVGPGGLPDAVVRFVLRAPVPGERTVALPMTDGGGLFGGKAGLFASIVIDGAPVRVRFDLRHRSSVVTAGTALALASANAGTLGSAVEEVEVAFGIARPVRTMTLARALAVGPLAIDTIKVRTTDFGNAEGIAQTGAVPDPDEIIVTAKGKRDRRRDRLTIGTDALARCSSLVFDKPAKAIRLTCG